MSVSENFKNIPQSPYGGRQALNVFFFFKFTTRSLTGGAREGGGPVAPPTGDRGACRPLLERPGAPPTGAGLSPEGRATARGPCACIGCLLNFLCPGALQPMSLIRVVSSVCVLLPVLDRIGPSLAALVPRVRRVAIQYCSTIYLCAILVLIFCVSCMHCKSNLQRITKLIRFVNHPYTLGSIPERVFYPHSLLI